MAATPFTETRAALTYYGGFEWINCTIGIRSEIGIWQPASAEGPSDDSCCRYHKSILVETLFTVKWLLFECCSAIALGSSALLPLWFLIAGWLDWITIYGAGGQLWGEIVSSSGAVNKIQRESGMKSIEVKYDNTVQKSVIRYILFLTIAFKLQVIFDLI